MQAACDALEKELPRLPEASEGFHVVFVWLRYWGWAKNSPLLVVTILVHGLTNLAVSFVGCYGCLSTPLL